MKTFTIHSKKYGDKIVKVDDEDYERVMNFPRKWWFRTQNRGRTGYVMTEIYTPKKRYTIQLHHFIIGKKDGLIVDHKDRDSLNNQKENLRFCTYSQNNMNQKKSNKYSGITHICHWVVRLSKDKKMYFGGNFKKKYMAVEAADNLYKKLHGDSAVRKKGKGVTYDNYWKVIIGKDNNAFRGGLFKTEIEAAKAADELRKKLHGEFAVLNFPDKK